MEEYATRQSQENRCKVIRIMKNDFFLIFSSKFKDLVNNRDCIVELREEYIDCEGPADWFEKENRTTLCEYLSLFIRLISSFNEIL